MAAPENMENLPCSLRGRCCRYITVKTKTPGRPCPHGILPKGLHRTETIRGNGGFEVPEAVRRQGGLSPFWKPHTSGQGTADRGEYRQAAGAVTEAVIRSVELIVQPAAPQMRWWHSPVKLTSEGGLSNATDGAGCGDRLLCDLGQ